MDTDVCTIYRSNRRDYTSAPVRLVASIRKLSTRTALVRPPARAGAFRIFTPFPWAAAAAQSKGRRAKPPPRSAGGNSASSRPDGPPRRRRSRRRCRSGRRRCRQRRTAAWTGCRLSGNRCPPRPLRRTGRSSRPRQPSRSCHSRRHPGSRRKTRCGGSAWFPNRTRPCAASRRQSGSMARPPAMKFSILPLIEY